MGPSAMALSTCQIIKFNQCTCGTTISCGVALSMWWVHPQWPFPVVVELLNSMGALGVGGWVRVAGSGSSCDCFNQT
jgi:hypothetical protein